MKFTNLSSAGRSILAALNASVGSGLSTYNLGKAASPQLDAQQAAAVLLDLRKNGLVYSLQKLQNQQYCQWHVSDFGKAVFMGRPEDVTALPDHVPAAPVNEQPAAGTRLRKWMIYPGSIGFHGTEQQLTSELAKLAQAQPGLKYFAYVLHAEAVLPVPTAQINLL